MKAKIFGTFISIALLSPPSLAFAEDNPDCSFAAPNALLQTQVYRSYTFRRTADNEIFESADLSKDVHFEIRQSQCVDFVVRKFTFTLKSNLGIRPLDFAIKAISNLKLSDAHERPTELLLFLKTGYRNGNGNRFSACRDGSSAPPGECSWDSLGGYSFEVGRERKHVIISVNEYISG
jgi:hypothetical protein